MGGILSAGNAQINLVYYLSSFNSLFSKTQTIDNNADKSDNYVLSRFLHRNS